MQRELHDLHYKTKKNQTAMQTVRPTGKLM